MTSSAKPIQVFCTMPSRSGAESMARQLVASRLAACVQVLGPLASTYRWQGTVENAEEWLCLIKSREDLYSRVESAILDGHPYEVPEIIAVPITAGNADYLNWLEQECGSTEST